MRVFDFRGPSIKTNPPNIRYNNLKGEDIDGHSHWSNDVPRGQKPELLEATDPNLAGDLDDIGGTGAHSGGMPGAHRGAEAAEQGTGGKSEKADAPVIQANKASTQQQPSASSMPSGGVKNLKSPQRIAKALAQNLHIGDYIGTRKMNGLPHEVLGYYQTNPVHSSAHTAAKKWYASLMGIKLN